MIQVFIKEFTGYLNSLIAYIVIGVFITASGLLIWVFPESNIFDFGYADLSTLFVFGPYVMMFLIPAITMRMFAEEKKSGTFEILMTRPVSDWEIILGKYLAGVLLVAFSILPTLIYYFSIWQLGNPPGNIDTPGVVGSYIGFMLLGSVFVAIGLLASTLTENQVISFVLATFLCFVFFDGFGSIAGLWEWNENVLLIDQLGISYHYTTMSKGLIDSRNLIYFLGVVSSFLMLTRFIIGSRKW